MALLPHQTTPKLVVGRGFSSWLFLRMLFILFLSPLPPGGPGEGPDCHFSKELKGFGPIPIRIWGKPICCF